MTDEKLDPDAKPLDKMTVTELREVAKELPDVTGAHGMKKAELLEVIKEAKGIKEEPRKKIDKKVAATVKELKQQIKRIRVQREQALAENNRRMAKICRRRISKLKKKTRQAA